MPIKDFGRRNKPRRVREGDSYTIDEDVELEQALPREAPPIEIQGESWGWTKGAPYPLGWREDDNYYEPN